MLGADILNPLPCDSRLDVSPILLLVVIKRALTSLPSCNERRSNGEELLCNVAECGSGGGGKLPQPNLRAVLLSLGNRALNAPCLECLLALLTEVVAVDDLKGVTLAAISRRLGPPVEVRYSLP